MVRTRDGGARKAVAAKAPRKVLASSGGALGALGSPSGKVNKYAGGNSVCPRPTPDWQKGIGSFITKNSKPAQKENTEPEDLTEVVTDEVPAGSSSSSSQCTAESGSSSSAAEPSSSSQPESPMKKNGLIDDSDED